MVRKARTLSALFVAFLLPCAQADPRWKIQFFYDKPDSVLHIGDLECSSIEHCLASGMIVDKNGREKGAIVLTFDGGKHWSLEPVGERPNSVFLLSDELGWMVTDRGVWITDDGGRTWAKQLALKGMLRAHFVNPRHGFAIGFPSAVYETVDGGKTWNKLAVAEQGPDAAKTDKAKAGGARASGSKAAALNTVYDCIAFYGDHGAILGQVTSPQDEHEPLWLNPATARLQKQKQSTNIMLESMDGGQSWHASTNLSFGDVTELAIAKAGFALALVEYHDYYSLPSSILRVEFGAAKPEVVYAERDRAVSDLALLGSGGAQLAAIEPPGNSNQVPIPGKLRMVRSNNLRDWLEEEVDYRAVAQRAAVAAPDQEHAWVATDTGMILVRTEAQAAAH